jgi:FtsZ-binding cell division protein ZapB
MDKQIKNKLQDIIQTIDLLYSDNHYLKHKLTELQNDINNYKIK